MSMTSMRLSSVSGLPIGLAMMTLRKTQASSQSWPAESCLEWALSIRSAKIGNDHKGEYNAMRLIDADALLQKGVWTVTVGDIKNAPTIDQVKHGKWINLISDPKHLVSEDMCSECGQIRKGYSSCNYCPNCGARMDGE